MKKIKKLTVVTIVVVCCFVIPLKMVLAVTLPSFTIRQGTGATHYIVAPQLNTTVISSLVKDFLFYGTATSTVLSGAQSGTLSHDDLLYSYYLSASIRYSCELHAEDGVSFESSNTAIATVNSSGDVTFISPGQMSFLGTKNNRKKSVSCNLSQTGAEYSEDQIGFTSTSLANEMSSSLSARINGLTPSSTTYNIYSASNDSTHVYTRNTNLFASDIDLTAIPVASSSYGSRFNGILVAPDILIQAHHMHSGGTIYFVDNSNNVTSRTVISSTQISGTDIQVARLSSDVAAGITPVPVLDSATFITYITNTARISSFDIPVVFTNQFRTLRISRFIGDYSNLADLYSPNESNFNPWYSVPISGDSGSPALAFINGEAVLVGTWYTPTSVSNVKNYITQINTAITSLGSPYSLTTVDLSGFPTY